MTPRLLDAGDGAVTVEFGSVISPELVTAVAALDHQVGLARARGELKGVIETMPTFRSLTVLYDPLRTSRAELDPMLLALVGDDGETLAAPGRRWRLPVCYGGDFGADLDDVATARGLKVDDVVRLHAGAQFTVYMLGFSPGMPFMGGLPEALSMPRRKEPRVRVPAGSVGITGPLANVYPWESPGGWQLLGRCPVPMFDLALPSPVLLAPGDLVRFEVVTPADYAELETALRGGALRADSFMQEPAA
jgi:KipI family sensor histidine kinase inhibitor